MPRALPQSGSPAEECGLHQVLPRISTHARSRHSVFSSAVHTIWNEVAIEPKKAAIPARVGPTHRCAPGGVQPPAIRAILVQCLVGEVAPSVAISRMLAAEGATTVRAAIDDVTLRAATISRASDMLVHDRVDELTQVFVEKVAELADESEAKTNRTGPPLERGSRAAESGERGESRTSG